MPGKVGEDPSRGEAVPRGGAVALVSLTLEEKRERSALGLGQSRATGLASMRSCWNFPHVPWSQGQLAPSWT